MLVKESILQGKYIYGQRTSENPDDCLEQSIETGEKSEKFQKDARRAGRWEHKR
jgi:hypothetical protein